MIRIASIGVVLAMVAVSTFNALAGTRSYQMPTGPRALGHDVFLSIDEYHRERGRETNGLIEAQVTLSNRDSTPFKTDQLTFSLSNAAGDRSLAMLPSELYGQVRDRGRLVREGVLESNQTLAIVLYFRSFSFYSPSLDLRVELMDEDGQVASRSFFPFALN